MASTIWNRLNKPSTLVGFGAVVAALLLLMWFLEPRKKATLDFPAAAPMQVGVGSSTTIAPPQKEYVTGQPGWLDAKPPTDPKRALPEKTITVGAVAPPSQPPPSMERPQRASSPKAAAAVMSIPALQTTMAVGEPKSPPVAPPPAAAIQTSARPSFDCATAAGQADRLICSDAELAKRDVELAALYRRAMTIVDDPSEMASQQRDWIALRRNPCATKACLLSAYADRKRDLQDWVGR